MKPSILFLFILAVSIFACQSLSAQEVWKMRIKYTDNVTTYTPVSDIQNITFTKRIPVAEAVDLGLSVKWASHNVGASKPEEYGCYYAWGETEEKAEYSITTYQYYKEDSYADLLQNICGSIHDVAHARWGEKWRMPTHEETQELVEKCSWEWTSNNGISGYIVTGPNSNSIFLPAAGCRYGVELDGTGMYGQFWTGTLPFSLGNGAYFLHFDNGSFSGNSFKSPSCGLSIRPVQD